MMSCTTVSLSSTCHNVIKLKSYLVTYFCSSSFSYFSLYISNICDSCSIRGCQSLYVLPKFLFLSFLSLFNFLLSYCATSFEKRLVPSAYRLPLRRFVLSSSSFIHSPCNLHRFFAADTIGPVSAAVPVFLRVA
jgi:hypothetical protein